jgi:hypothetical protein
LFGGGERANACADQRTDTRADAGFTRFALAGIGLVVQPEMASAPLTTAAIMSTRFFILFP